MNTRFNDLLASAAADGASTPLGILAPRDEEETDQLMQAWYLERQISTECILLLDEAAQLLRSLLAAEMVSDANRRKTLVLFHAIKEARRVRRNRGF